MLKFALVTLCVIAVAQAQRGGARVRPLDDNELRTTTTPVPILRQINKVDEDGSYTYGFEAADGSYKIESKSKTGEVRGKYGYYDDTGVLREIEYGASRQGFHPQGTDIRAPEAASAMAHDPIDDSGYYDPERYERPFAYQSQQPQQQQQQQPNRRPGGRRVGGRRQQKQYTLPAPAAPQQNYYQQQAPAAPQQNYYQQQPQQQQHVVNYQAPAPATPAPPPAAPQQNYYQPQAPQPQPFNQAQLFHGHPARNIDINTGSYSVQYHG